ncbi:hypothetical protein DQW09_06380 [Ensifer adhaerens]|nr:hypothetical protein DQW09_06380 [Ensifer adhaerens]
MRCGAPAIFVSGDRFVGLAPHPNPLPARGERGRARSERCRVGQPSDETEGAPIVATVTQLAGATMERAGATRTLRPPAGRRWPAGRMRGGHSFAA